MIFSKKIIKNNRTGLAQWDSVEASRKSVNLSEQMYINSGVLATNDGLIPQDVYQEFDNTTVELMQTDNGDTFLNDLMAMSKPVAIGKLVHKYRKASGAGNVQTSMTGQSGLKWTK